MESLKMRELGGQDLYLMIKILSKVKVKDLVLEIFEAKKNIENREVTDKVIKEEGLKLAGNVIEQLLCNIDFAKSEINSLLARLCSVSIQDIEKLGLVEYSDLLIEFVSKEELSSFLKSIFSSRLVERIK